MTAHRPRARISAQHQGTLSRTALQQARECLQAGSVIAYPTESCYGLGCDPRNNRAIISLLKIKHRHWQKGLILIASSIEQLYPFIDMKRLEKDQSAMDRISSSWPGPVTWVLPAADSVSHYLRGKHQGIAVRVTGHPLANLLCRTIRGPIVSTSANPEGHPPALSASGVQRYFADEIELIIDGPLGTLPQPTPIYDVLSGNTLRS